MSSIFLLPLEAAPQNFDIDIAGVSWNISNRWNPADEGGWFIDIYTADNVPVLLNVPLVTGVDILEQYAHLGFNFSLAVATLADVDAVPTESNLGVASNVYIVLP